MEGRGFLKERESPHPGGKAPTLLRCPVPPLLTTSNRCRISPIESDPSGEQVPLCCVPCRALKPLGSRAGCPAAASQCQAAPSSRAPSPAPAPVPPRLLAPPAPLLSPPHRRPPRRPPRPLRRPPLNPLHPLRPPLRLHCLPRLPLPPLQTPHQVCTTACTAAKFWVEALPCHGPSRVPLGALCMMQGH